jgi:hypothetical protein
VGLILRLVPYMRASTMARAFADLLAALQRSENASAVVLHLQDWPALLFRATMFMTPTAFPSRQELLPGSSYSPRSSNLSSPPSPVGGMLISRIAGASSGGGVDAPAPAPAALTSADSASAPAPTDAAQLAVNDAYAQAETSAGLLARATLHVHNGWRAFQRLLALQVRRDRPCPPFHLLC